MSLKLNSSGGGSVTLQEPTTASTRTLTLPDATGTVVAADGSGNVSVTSFTVNSNNISAVNSLGFRNRIINGDMRIDQRNAGASVTPTDGAYTLDRWQAYLTQASKFTVQRNAGSVTPPSGFTNYLGITSSSAYTVLASDIFATGQQIEGFNTADLGWGAAGAQTITLSFWVRSSLTGTFGGTLTNNAQNRFYAFSYTVSAANTWEYETITIAGDTSGTWATDNSAGIRVRWGLGVGSNNSGTAGSWGGSSLWSATGATSVVGTNGATFYITGVQLEAGSVATPFERIDYGRQLAMCQRYYWKSFAASTAPANAVGVNTGEIAFSACTAGAVFVRSNDTRFTVEMRNAPTITFFNPVSANSQAYNSSIAADCSGTTLFAATTSSFKWYCTAASATAAGHSIGVHATASAEL